MGAAGAPGGISYDYFFLSGTIGTRFQTFDVNCLSNLDVISAAYNGIFLNTNDSGVQYSKQFQDGSTSTIFYDSAVDSSDNIHVIGSLTAGADSIYAKFDSSGSQLAGTKISTSTYNEYGRKLRVDSLGNIIFFTTYYAAPWESALVKMSPSGTILWEKRFTHSNNVYLRGLAIDNNDNIVVSLQCGIPTGVEVIKYNSSGTLQWRYHYNNSNNYDFTGFPGLELDSNGNIYIGGYGGLANSIRRNTIVKLNSSGTIQWHSTNYSYSAASQFIYGLHVSSNDKLYFCGNYYNYNTFDSHAHWTELNTSTGAVNLARWCIFPNTNDHKFFDIKTDVDGNVVCGGYRQTSTTNEINIARFPSDGSLTGTYSAHNDNLTYAAVSPLTTDHTALLSSGSGILTISTGSSTTSSLSLSSSNTSNSVTTTILT